METERPPPRTRPRNRRALILAAATDLFVRDGYPNVTMAEIARAVSIGPSALYRHFPSKEDLLYEAVRQPFDAVAPTLSPATPETLEPRIDEVARWVLEHRGLGVLWQRESRHLPTERRNELRSQLVALQRVVTADLRGRRPELTAPEADLLSWGITDAMMSVSYQRIQLPREEYVALLADLARSIARASLPTGIGSASTTAPVAEGGRGSTFDRLVAAAVRLFAERSYQSVGIDEVAAMAGIAGPSIYHYFDGKADLLTAAMGHGAEQLLGDAAAIAAGKGSVRTKLDRLVWSYIDFAFDNSNVLDVMIAEIGHLDAAARRAAIHQQRQYIRAWVDLVEAINPDRAPGHARVRVQAVLTMTSDIARTAHLRRQAGTREAVFAIGSAILH